MRRHLFNVACGLSLVVFVAAAVLWVWSHVSPTPQGAPLPPLPPRQLREVGLGGGYLAISHVETFAPPAGLGGGYPIGGDSSAWNVMGVVWRRQRLTLLNPADRSVVAVMNHSTVLAVRLVVPMLLSAVLPAWWLVRRQKARREGQKGMCRVCGYDLRASTGRCPECGTPIMAATS